MRCVKCGWRPVRNTMPSPKGQGHPRMPLEGLLVPVRYPASMTGYECIDEVACAIRRVVRGDRVPLSGLSPLCGL